MHGSRQFLSFGGEGGTTLPISESAVPRGAEGSPRTARASTLPWEFAEIFSWGQQPLSKWENKKLGAVAQKGGQSDLLHSDLMAQRPPLWVRHHVHWCQASLGDAQPWRGMVRVLCSPVPAWCGTSLAGDCPQDFPIGLSKSFLELHHAYPVIPPPCPPSAGIRPPPQSEAHASSLSPSRHFPQ